MSLRKAVNEKCKECIYDLKSQGTLRQQVENCTSMLCPLFNCRPLQVQNSIKKSQSQSMLIKE